MWPLNIQISVVPRESEFLHPKTIPQCRGTMDLRQTLFLIYNLCSPVIFQYIQATVLLLSTIWHFPNTVRRHMYDASGSGIKFWSWALSCNERELWTLMCLSYINFLDITEHFRTLVVWTHLLWAMFMLGGVLFCTYSHRFAIAFFWSKFYASFTLLKIYKRLSQFLSNINTFHYTRSEFGK